MKHSEVLNILESGEEKGINALSKNLQGSEKNTIIKALLDYYDGIHWSYQDNVSTSRTTRSGKEMWELKDKRGKTWGLSPAELKIWNVCDSTVDIYTSYVRGNIDDHNRINIDDKIQGDLATELNQKIGDLDRILSRASHRMGIQSVAFAKYKKGGAVEFINADEIFPIYEGDERVGTMRQYEVDGYDSILKDMPEDEKSKKHTYLEIWIRDKNEKMRLYKYLDGDDISDGKTNAPYDFDPYFAFINKEHEFRNFDENDIEISDVDRIIDIQDDLNAVITDISTIIRKVAIPVYRIAKEIFEKIIKGELSGDAVKEELEKLEFTANRIIPASVERMETSGLPSTSLGYVESIYQHLYMKTGIPKSIYISEGMGNIAAETVEHLTESLKRRVDEKRMNLTAGVKQYIYRYLKEEKGMKDEEAIKAILDKVSITWAPMFAPTRRDTADVVMKAKQTGALPEMYIIEKLLKILGDQERYNEVVGMMTENNLTQKTNLEKFMLKSDLEKERKNTEIEKAQKEAEQAKGEKRLIEKEAVDLISQL